MSCSLQPNDKPAGGRDGILGEDKGLLHVTDRAIRLSHGEATICQNPYLAITAVGFLLGRLFILLPDLLRPLSRPLQLPPFG